MQRGARESGSDLGARRAQGRTAKATQESLYVIERQPNGIVEFVRVEAVGVRSLIVIRANRKDFFIGIPSEVGVWFGKRRPLVESVRTAAE